MQSRPQNGRLPGEELVSQGVADLACGAESVEALLVSTAPPRLRRLGLTIEAPIPSPERRLYDLLGERHGDAAHSRYNALVRRLVSFESAAAKRLSLAREAQAATAVSRRSTKTGSGTEPE